MRALFGELLRQFMKEKKITQGQLADMANIPLETIRGWLKNEERKPQIWHYPIRIAHALQLELGEVEEFLDASSHSLNHSLRMKAEDALRKALAQSNEIDEYDYTKILGQLKEWLALPVQLSQIYGDLPSKVKNFHGRDKEFALLHERIRGDKKQLIVIVGSGGMGKTTLVSHFLHDLLEQSENSTSSCPFHTIIWTSLVDAPTLKTTLHAWLQVLSDQDLFDVPNTPDAQVNQLLQYLKQKSILLVLDNLESILESGNFVGSGYLEGYGDYADLINRINSDDHKSSLIITTREVPALLESLARDYSYIKIFRLAGLSMQAAHELLTTGGISATSEQLTAVAERYAANPLSLKLIPEIVSQAYGGQIENFLIEETLIFDDISWVLSQQLERLSPLEKEILIWLAVERQPVTISHIYQQLVLPPHNKGLLTEATLSLQRRSLIESQTGHERQQSPPILGQHNHGSAFFLQNVVLEFVTEQWVNIAIQEFLSGEFDYLYRHPIILAHGPNHLQDAQRRLVLKPIADAIQSTIGTQQWQVWARKRLDTVRAVKGKAPQYAAGNLLNLLIHVDADLNGLDFSLLTVWQVAAQDKLLRNIDFTKADLANAVFTDTFSIIRSLSYSPNGQFLAVGTSDGVIRFWHANTLEFMVSIEAHIGLIRTLCFSPDGRWLASGGEDGKVNLWDLTPIIESDNHFHGDIQLTLLRQFEHHGPVSRISYSSQGNTFVTASFDGYIYQWSMQDSDTWLIRGHEGEAVRAIAYHPSGRFFASCGDDGHIRLWNAQNGSCLQSIKSRTEHVLAVDFSADGQFMASCVDEQIIQIWRLVPDKFGNDFHSDVYIPELQEFHTFWGHKQTILNLTFGPNSDTVASCGNDQVILIWELQSGQIEQQFHGHAGWIDSLAFSPNGQSIASASVDRTLCLWNKTSGKLSHQIHGHSICIMSIAVDPRYLGWVTSDHVIRFWNLDSERPCRELDGHTSFIWQVAYSPEGLYIASASDDATICLWDALNSSLLYRIVHHAAVYTVEFHPRISAFVSSDYSHRIRLWSTDSGKELRSFCGANDLIWQLTFNPAGNLLAAGCEDGCIYLWSVEQGTLKQVLDSHTKAIRSIAISPSQPILASGSLDQTIGIWNLHSGKLLKRLTGHQGGVLCVTFSSSGKLLASGGTDYTIRLWDMTTLQLICTFFAHTEQIRAIKFCHNDEVIISGSDDGTVKVWDISRLGDTNECTVYCIQTSTVPGPYYGMKISGVTGISAAQQEALKALGAVG